MSGKGAGKKRNRAAQSEPHGYQESPSSMARKTGANHSSSQSDPGSRQRVVEKIKDLQRRQRDKEKAQEDQPER